MSDDRVDADNPGRRRRPAALVLGGIPRQAVVAAMSRRFMLTAMTFAAVGSLGVFLTQALLSDQVTMKAVDVTGGTLDIKVDGSVLNQDGPNAEWGTFTAALTGMKPGESRYADITLKNPGSLAASLKVTVTGTDTTPDYAGDCFGLYFRELDNLNADVASVGAGTDLGSADTDAGVEGFTTAAANANLTLWDDGATKADSTWETTDTHKYRLTVRMVSGCTQGGTNTAAASGQLNFSFNAAQV